MDHLLAKVKDNKFVSRVDGLLSVRLFEWLLITATALVFLVTLVSANSIRDYSSDDVTTQVVAHMWDTKEVKNADVGTDTYILKIPFYDLTDLISSHNSRDKLFAAVLVFNGILLAGIIVFVHFILLRKVKYRRLNVALLYLPLMWLLGLDISPILSHSQISRVTDYMCINCRNAEIGIALVITTLLIYYFEQAKQKITVLKVIGAAALIIFLSLFLFNDPYFIYIFIIPCLIATLIMWTTNRISFNKALGTGAFLVASTLVSMVIVKHIFAALGMHQLNNISKQFSDPNQYLTAIQTTLQNLFKQFSAEIWDTPVSLHLLPKLFNAGFLVISLVAFVKVIASKKRDELGTMLLIIFVAFNLLLYTFTSNNFVSNDRYIILAVFGLALLIGVWAARLKNLKWQYLLVIFFSIGILLNVAANAHIFVNQQRSGAVQPNSLNYQIISTVEKYGLTKGYTQYWDGDIDTYLSDYKVNFLPVTCGNTTGLQRFYWVINKSDFTIPAQQSFYVYNDLWDWPSINPCTSQLLTKLYGITPIRTIKINSDYTIYIYNQDIGRYISTPSQP